MKKIIVPICLLPIIFISCKSVVFGWPHYTVNGMIYDFENRPVSGYEICLDEKKTTSDVTGRFVFSKIPKGEYTLTGMKTGYEKYSGELVIEDDLQVVYIRVPSQKQLLDLLDDALTKDNLDDALTFMERANATGVTTTESAFYSAVVFYRMKKTEQAIGILKDLIKSGVTDRYVQMFLEDLEKKKVNEK